MPLWHDPPVILDRYRVIDQAGSGGYGTVVHAFDTHLKRDVAIKCIELSEDELAAARLEALEARMAADFGRGRSRGIGPETGVAGRMRARVQSRPPVQAWVPPRAILLAARRRRLPADPISWRPATSAVGAGPRPRCPGAPPRGCRPGRTGTTSVILTMTLSMSLVQMI